MKCNIMWVVGKHMWRLLTGRWLMQSKDGFTLGAQGKGSPIEVRPPSWTGPVFVNMMVSCPFCMANSILHKICVCVIRVFFLFLFSIFYISNLCYVITSIMKHQQKPN